MSKITLENGIILDDQEGMAPDLASWAKQKGLKDARVFVANDNGRKTYLLVIGEEPIYENQKSEAVATHIDILAFLQNEKEV